MTLELLVSCMHQKDDSLLRKSCITSDAVVINQCDQDQYHEYLTEHGTARVLSTTQRGLTKSRNMAIRNARADVCLLCDDDEVFVPNYEQKVLSAYENLPQADVIIFKMVNRPPSFPDRIQELKFPKTMKVSSWQISFRRQRLLDSGVRFDELLGAGTGNGAEEELKFLLDCEKAGLKMYTFPQKLPVWDRSSPHGSLGLQRLFLKTEVPLPDTYWGLFRQLHTRFIMLSERKNCTRVRSPR